MFVLELYQYVINSNRVTLILIYFRRRIIIKVKKYLVKVFVMILDMAYFVFHSNSISYLSLDDEGYRLA